MCYKGVKEGNITPTPGCIKHEGVLNELHASVYELLDITIQHHIQV